MKPALVRTRQFVMDRCLFHEGLVDPITVEGTLMREINDDVHLSF